MSFAQNTVPQQPPTNSKDTAPTTGAEGTDEIDDNKKKKRNVHAALNGVVVIVIIIIIISESMNLLVFAQNGLVMPDNL